MAERSWDGDYRYGFNGKEKDDEGMGGGLSTYDYGFRIYNPALGKFLSLDPLLHSFPWNSPYCYAENRVIDGIDVDGKEWSAVRSYDPITGIFNVALKCKIGVYNDTKAINTLNREAYMMAIKSTVESTFTQFDKASNVNYTMELEYEFINDDQINESPFNLILRDENDIVLGGGDGITSDINNTQSNTINVGVTSLVQIATTVAHELGHTLGLFHPHAPFKLQKTNGVYQGIIPDPDFKNNSNPTILDKYKNATQQLKDGCGGCDFKILNNFMMQGDAKALIGIWSDQNDKPNPIEYNETNVDMEQMKVATKNIIDQQ